MSGPHDMLMVFGFDDEKLRLQIEGLEPQRDKPKRSLCHRMSAGLIMKLSAHRLFRVIGKMTASNQHQLQTTTVTVGGDTTYFKSRNPSLSTELGDDVAFNPRSLNPN